MEDRNERNAHRFSAAFSDHGPFHAQIVAGGGSVSDLKVKRFVFWEDFVEQIATGLTIMLAILRLIMNVAGTFAKVDCR